MVKKGLVWLQNGQRFNFFTTCDLVLPHNTQDISENSCVSSAIWGDFVKTRQGSPVSSRPTPMRPHHTEKLINLIFTTLHSHNFKPVMTCKKTRRGGPR